MRIGESCLQMIIEGRGVDEILKGKKGKETRGGGERRGEGRTQEQPVLLKTLQNELCFFLTPLSLIVSSLFENIPFHVLKAFGEYSLPDTISNPSGSGHGLRPTHQWIDINGWYLGTLGFLQPCRCLTRKHMWRGAKDTPGFRSWCFLP